MSRHTFFIRAVASITGDITIGYAMASACVWVIQSAALGFFLGFLLWLLTIIAALSLSQYVVHPAVAALLSDRKLDQSLAVTADALRTGAEAAKHLWGWAQQVRADFRPMAT
jgi:O-antigen ligase